MHFFRELKLSLSLYWNIFFICILAGVVSLGVFGYHKGLETAINNAFKTPFEEEENDFTYELKMTLESITTPENIDSQIALNEMLSDNEDWEYSSAYLMDITTKTLKNTALALYETSDEEANEEGVVEITYTIKSLFVDEAAAKKIGIYDYMEYIFAEEANYADYVPVIAGNNWHGDGYAAGEEGLKVNSEIGEMSLRFEEYFNPKTFIEFEGEKLELDNIIVVPMIKLSDSTAITTQDGRDRYRKLYEILNSGKLKSELTANNLQAAVNEAIKDSEIDAEINISGADYSNELLFRTDRQALMNELALLSVASIMISGCLYFLYEFIHILKGRRYLRILTLNGVSKIEFSIIAAIRHVLYYVLTIIPSIAVVKGLEKFTFISMPPIGYLLLPTLVVMLVACLASVLFIVIWDPYKRLRAGKEVDDEDL